MSGPRLWPFLLSLYPPSWIVPGAPTLAPSIMQTNVSLYNYYPQTCILKPIKVFRGLEESTLQVREQTSQFYSRHPQQVIGLRHMLKNWSFSHIKWRQVSHMEPTPYIFLKVPHEWVTYGIHRFFSKFLKKFNTLLVKILGFFMMINVYDECDPACLTKQICFKGAIIVKKFLILK